MKIDSCCCVPTTTCCLDAGAEARTEVGSHGQCCPAEQHGVEVLTRERGAPLLSEPLPLAVRLNVSPTEGVPSALHSPPRVEWGGVDRRVGGLGSMGTNWQRVYDTLGFS